MYSKYLYSKIHDDLVLDFCNKCKELNYVNNDSFDSMKWYWKEVQWVGTFKNNTLVSMSGIHKFPEINKNAFRIMFRGATLPGISSKFLNFEQVPLKQEWAYLQNHNSEFYVTFNIDSKIGSKSSKMINAVKRMNCFSYYSTMNYFNVEQEVYVLL